MTIGKKSGDSKLADAKAAQEKDQAATLTPSERSASGPDLVQDSIEQAKSEGAEPSRVAKMEAAFERLLAAHEAQQKRINELETRAPMTVAEAKIANPVVDRRECPACGQYVVACGGQHKTVKVMVKNLENVPSFDGVRINGIRYYGICVVPLAAADEILARVNIHEDYQLSLRTNRGKRMEIDRMLSNIFAQAASKRLAIEE